MRLSFEEVKSITFGFVHSFEDANGMHFAKCTDKQVAAFGSFWEGLGNNAKATTGIRLDFHTSSKHFAFGAASGRRFELYINGTFREIYKAQDGESAEFSYDINEAGEENRVTLYFPAHDTPGVLSYVELDDGATVVPHKFDCKIFFIGDSITQGWNSTYDSLSYANRVSDFFNADSVIQGVGGAFFHPSIFDEAIDYDPDSLSSHSELTTGAFRRATTSFARMPLRSSRRSRKNSQARRSSVSRLSGEATRASSSLRATSLTSARR